MNAKQYLEQLEIIDTNINQDLEWLEEMKDDAAGIRGVNYSKDRVQTSSAGNKLCEDVVRYVTVDEEIHEELHRFNKTKKQVIQEIRALKDKNYINILFKVYVQYKSIKIAASEMGLSYSYVVELHKRALRAFETTNKNLQYLI